MRYSIYVFLDDLNRPYYVGMTNNFTRRKKDHLFEIKTKNMLPKYRKARQLYMLKKHPFKMRVIATTRNKAKAFKLERQYIKKYRREQYQLMNCTWGGPDELPMRINKPRKQNTKGLIFKTKRKTSIKKKARRISRNRRKS